MAKRLNGNLKFYIYIGLLIASLAGTFAVFGNDVLWMKPQVTQNTEHRIQDEAADQLIQTTLTAILDEVKK